MNELIQEAETLAEYHAQVTDLMTAFELLKPDWNTATPTAEATQGWFMAWESWNTHYAVLEHLLLATAPETPTIVRLTLFSAAAVSAKEVTGGLTSALSEEAITTLTLAEQLGNIPPVL